MFAAARRTLIGILCNSTPGVRQHTAYVDIRVRSWSKLTFYDPEPVLRELRRLERDPALLELPDVVRRLRTNQLKTDREARDALIFAHGMAGIVGAKVLVAPGETEDCDFVAKAVVNDIEHFFGVQLKELAPADLNEHQTLEHLAKSLAKYAKSDSTLAIHLNRRVTISLEDLAAIETPFAERWFFWASDPEYLTWQLFGGAPGTPVLHNFTQPE